MKSRILLVLGFFFLSFQFPADHGFHKESQLEWCYFVGEVVSDQGRKFGYELSFFRAKVSQATELYPVHFAISDLDQKKHHTSQSISRSQLGLAFWKDGNLVSGDYQFTSHSPTRFSIQAKPRDSSGLALNLELHSTRPILLHGNQGLSRKSRKNPEIYSQYYSVTRLETTGSLQLEGKTHSIVSGLSWMDHEWSGFESPDQKPATNLSDSKNSWDWVCLQMEDGTDIMAFNFRKNQDTKSESFGTLRTSDQKVYSYESLGAVELTPNGKDWQSPVSKITYPMEWKLKISEKDFLIQPAFWEQEFDARKTAGMFYWEGAIRATGSDGTKGIGYLELKGRKQKSSKSWYSF